MKGRHAFAVAATIALSLMMHTTRAGAEPTKINNCTTITERGSYELANNLETCKTKGGVSDCLVIAANFVTIDLRGFEMRFCTLGRDVLQGDGITDGGEERKGIVVRDGTITNFRHGIFLLSEGVHVDRVRVIGNTQIGMTVGQSSTVTNNTALNNGNHGVLAGPRSTVSGNTSNNNGHDGLTVGLGSTVTGNTASSNAQDGITGFTADINLIGNTAYGNGQNGINVVCPSNVIGNTATGNSNTNIAFVAPALCNTAHNLAP